MRYLKVIAQDRNGDGRADLVMLEFYQAPGPNMKSVVVNEAVAVDFDADGKVDYKRGDVNHNGKENSIDQRLLEIFANSYLKMNWFNDGEIRDRYMKVFAEDVHSDGTPNVVKLHLHHAEGGVEPASLMSWHSVFDGNNDGVLESVANGDANHDGVIEQIDGVIVQSLANVFLMFRWK